MNRPLFEYITQPEKFGLSRGRKAALLSIVIAFHVLVIYFILTAKFHIKILMLGGKVQNVILVPPIKTSFPSNYKTVGGAFPGAGGSQGFSPVTSAGGGRTVSGGRGRESSIPLPAQGQGAASGGRTAAQSGAAIPPGPGAEFRLNLPVKPGPLTAKEPEAVIGGARGNDVPPPIKMRSYTLTDYWGRRPGLSAEPGQGESPGGPLGSPHELIGSGSGDKVIYRGNASPGVRGYNISPWAQILVNIIQRNWVLPPSDEAKANGRVGITIVVDKSGLLSAVRVINSSNNQLLDRTALDAIARSLPLPRLPEDFPDRMLEAYLLFDYHARK